mmetsp:Transcript_27001/g.41139  ORF Transcript_27001/g.41139 Transcript_27001/m.41139 type:complete len:301 (+) Transcript_27001:660-1562(+)
MQINDNPYPQYHRNNGLVKMGFKSSPIFPKEKDKKHFVKRPREAAMAMLDRINIAYVRARFNDTQIVSGLQVMPFKPDLVREGERTVNMLGIFMFSMLITLGLPSNLYLLVHEKESRLLETMKINGLRKRNYWIVHYLCFYLQFLVSILVFYLFGRYVSKLAYFTDTDPWIFIFWYIGWGLAQTSFSFFLAVFLNRSQNASMIGYAVSIVLGMLSATALCTNYPYEYHPDVIDTMLWYLHYIPTFPTNRVNFYLSSYCGFRTCIADYDRLHPDVKLAIVSSYYNAVIFLVLAVYLNEVVP